MYVLGSEDSYAELGRQSGDVQRAIVCGFGLVSLKVSDALASRGAEVILLDPGWEAGAYLCPLVSEIVRLAACKNRVLMQSSRLQRT